MQTNNLVLISFLNGKFKKFFLYSGCNSSIVPIFNSERVIPSIMQGSPWRPVVWITKTVVSKLRLSIFFLGPGESLVHLGLYLMLDIKRS